MVNVTQVTKIDFVYYTDVNHVTEKARRSEVSTHFKTSTDFMSY